LIGASIDSSTPGGTARGNPSVQYRLRIQGQKARYLKPGEVAPIRAAIARGRQLRKLQREVERLQGQLHRIGKKAEALGLMLPES
jgi:AmiR/NasT family two-component response regulator